MRKPLIGISGGMIIEQGGLFPGYERAYVNNDYVEAVVNAGGIPVILPIISDKQDIREQVRNIDGLIISGGNDINPIIYGEEPLEKLGFIHSARDTFDLELINEAKAQNMPILGICRGLQILNVAFGGTLYQDLSYDKDSYVKHAQNSHAYTPGHLVNIVEGTVLSEIIGHKIVVNSFHHQAIKDVGEDLIVSARAMDNVIEGIEARKGLIMGVQWHPEMMAHKFPEMRKFFEVLVENAGKEKG